MCIDKHVIRCDAIEQARLMIEPGDVIEFHRGSYSHWAICVAVRRDWMWRKYSIEVAHRFGESTADACIRSDEFDLVYGSTAEEKKSGLFGALITNLAVFQRPFSPYIRSSILRIALHWAMLALRAKLVYGSTAEEKKSGGLFTACFGESTADACIRSDEFDLVYGSTAEEKKSGGLLATLANISLGTNVTTSVTIHKCTDPSCRLNSVEQAKSKIGESGYNLLWNNCEHFVRWCVEGVEHSTQVASGRDRTIMHMATFVAGAVAMNLLSFILGRNPQ